MPRNKKALSYACGFCNELCSHYLQPPKVPRTFGASTKSKLKDYAYMLSISQGAWIWYTKDIEGELL